MPGEENRTKYMSVVAACEGCGNKFSVSKRGKDYSIIHQMECVANGKSVFLTYYDCPECGNRHFVQIDDKGTRIMFKEIEHLFIKMASKKKNGKEIPRKQSDKYKKLTKRLRELRENLMKEYNGVMLHDDESGTDFIVRFSV